MSIPDFPNLKPLAIEDKPAFDEYFKNNFTSISEYTFTNIYIWRKLDNTELTMINGNICMLVTAPDRKRYFMMPLGKNEMKDTLKKCISVSGSVVRLSQDFIDTFVSGDNDFLIEEDPDNFDYIYSSQDLVELKGRKYDAKRNHLNNLLKNHTFEYEQLNNSHLDQCIKLSEEWCREKKRESEAFPNLECEGEVVKEALMNCDLLEYKGAVIKIGGQIKAFSIGERLNNDTAVIHIEKADPKIRGLSQLINKEFIKNEWAGIPFINREQDMGHLGLRKAKLSYHPIRMDKKYSVSLKTF